VLGAAADLGYAGPDPVARSLRRRRSGLVGAIVGERLLYAFRDPVAVSLLDGIAEVLGPLGVGLLLLPGDAERSGPSADLLGGVPLDAAVFATCGLDDDPGLPLLRRRGVPIVGVDGPRADDVVFVGVEDRAGSVELARHLHGCGHRRVAVLALPLRLDGARGIVTAERSRAAPYRVVSERLGGIREVYPNVPVWEAAANAVEEGEAGGLALLGGQLLGGQLSGGQPARRPTAIVAQSDLLAAGVLRAAAALGLRVPEDVSVAGFDGVDLPWLAPVRLTTVVQPTVDKGRTVGVAVAALLAGQHPADVVLPVTLRVGDTTGPAPA
jgi:DNA-binding LacI/PurR family transcriptional regulator